MRLWAKMIPPSTVLYFFSFLRMASSEVMNLPRN